MRVKDGTDATIRARCAATTTRAQTRADLFTESRLVDRDESLRGWHNIHDPMDELRPQSGGATAYGVLPNCQVKIAPITWGYEDMCSPFPMPQISLEFETVLGETDILSDLLTLEHSDQQMLPRTQLTIRSVTGTGLWIVLCPVPFRRTTDAHSLRL